MRFGLFGSANAPRGEHQGRVGEGFFDFVKRNIEAERLEFHSTFLVEHDFSRVGQISASLSLLTWLAAKTTTLRLGTGVVVLPWHNPILLAEQAATLDVLSQGRLDFGVGRGYRFSEFDGFAMPVEEAEPRFNEAFDLIVKAWTSDEPFSHRGQFWSCKDIIVEPPTAQKPHPPIWIAAGSPESIRTVAAHGCNLLLDQFASPALTGERIALFRKEIEGQGCIFDPYSVAVARYCCVSDNDDELQAAYQRLLKSNEDMVKRSVAPDGQQLASHVLRYTQRAGGPTAHAVYGSAQKVQSQLEELRSVGAHYVLLSGNDSVNRSFPS
jgi:alkanesulfonate monooxygenase SsuD/methylene tetrahydromethanopterin reductase-like flavin-dependent oxidoreductase (luciferase family)